MAVVLITGCSSGFGYEAALAFARAGETVIASMRNPGCGGPPLKKAAASCAGTLDIVELDVTRPETFHGIVQDVVRRYRRLDVLVNNAGVLQPGALEDLTEGDFRRVLETNYVGPMLLTRAVLPQVRSQRSGCIIMISSLSGVAGLPCDVAYTGSKFALEGATEALRHEVDRWGIRVALVEAAQYATGIFDATTSDANVLPANYPKDSLYRELIFSKLQQIRARLPEAHDPAQVAELLVTISRTDGSQLRWPADDTARRVLATMFGQNDSERDRFLREVSGTSWWSEGRDSPEG